MRVRGGLRVTDKATVEIVEMVLAGSINKQIVGWINAEGGTRHRPVRQGRQHGHRQQGHPHVVGPRRNIEQHVDLGFVGEPETVDRARARHGARRRADPGAGAGRHRRRRQTYNVNADTFAGAIAGALRAKRLLLLTDVPGVLDKNRNLITELTVDAVPRA